MQLINQIVEKIKANQFEFSKHAVDQSIIRRISLQEMKESIIKGEVIEDYPKDYYGPGCLIFGRTEAGRCIYNVAIHPGRL